MVKNKPPPSTQTPTMPPPPKPKTEMESSVQNIADAREAEMDNIKNMRDSTAADFVAKADAHAAERRKVLQEPALGEPGPSDWMDKFCKDETFEEAKAAVKEQAKALFQARDEMRAQTKRDELWRQRLAATLDRSKPTSENSTVPISMRDAGDDHPFRASAPMKTLSIRGKIKRPSSSAAEAHQETVSTTGQSPPLSPHPCPANTEKEETNREKEETNREKEETNTNIPPSTPENLWRKDIVYTPPTPPVGTPKKTETTTQTPPRPMSESFQASLKDQDSGRVSPSVHQLEPTSSMHGLEKLRFATTHVEGPKEKVSKKDDVKAPNEKELPIRNLGPKTEPEPFTSLWAQQETEKRKAEHGGNTIDRQKWRQEPSKASPVSWTSNGWKHVLSRRDSGSPAKVCCNKHSLFDRDPWSQGNGGFGERGPERSTDTPALPKSDSPIPPNLQFVDSWDVDIPVRRFTAGPGGPPSLEKPLDQAKTDEAKAEQAKADQAKTDQVKADQAKADQLKANQAKTVQAKFNNVPSESEIQALNRLAEAEFAIKSRQLLEENRRSTLREKIIVQQLDLHRKHNLIRNPSLNADDQARVHARQLSLMRKLFEGTVLTNGNEVLQPAKEICPSTHRDIIWELEKLTSNRPPMEAPATLHLEPSAQENETLYDAMKKAYPDLEARYVARTGGQTLFQKWNETNSLGESLISGGLKAEAAGMCQQEKAAWAAHVAIDANKARAAVKASAGAKLKQYHDRLAFEAAIPADKEEKPADIAREATKLKEPEEYAEPFINFMSENPTVWHAVQYWERKLEKAGFEKLSPRQSWNDKLKPNGKYYVNRNGTSLIAFSVGGAYKSGNGIAMVAAHSDSLTARLKPVSTKNNKAGYVQLGVAPYAGGLNETWWDRDLGIGGRVLVKDEKTGAISQKLVKLDWPIARIPSLAPHFGVGMFGQNNKETQLVPIIGLDNSDIASSTTSSEQFQTLAILGAKSSFISTQPPKLVNLIAKELGIQNKENIVNWELELFDTQPAQLGGLEKEFIFAGRIDDKVCSWSSIEALISNSASEESKSSGIISMVGLFDDEEIGSLLRQGANGNFLPGTVERIVESFNGSSYSPNLLLETYAKSFLVSFDVTHAANPNFLEKYLENHAPRLNVGLSIEADSNGHTTTDSVSTAIFERLAEKAGEKLQVFMIRNDSRSGGTVGPMLSSKMGVRAIDVGVPQLSMHSVRATIGAKDPGLGARMIYGVFQGWEGVDGEFAAGEGW